MNALCTSQRDAPGGGGGADPGDSDRAKYRCQKSPPGAKIPCQNPRGQKKYFLPFLIKSSDFPLGGGRKRRQKSPPRGKMSRQKPRGCPPTPPRGRHIDRCISFMLIHFILQWYCGNE